MSAGTGIIHSEYNASNSELVHFYQIWITPKQIGIDPGYEQKSYIDRIVPGELCLLASPDGRDSSVRVHQDVNLYLANIDSNQSLDKGIDEGHNIWIQMVSGSANLNGDKVHEGDGIEISDERKLSITATDKATFLLFELVP